MSADGRLVGAATLKRLRLARGWSLAGLARAVIGKAGALGQPLDAGVLSVQRTVARWESSKAPILPGDRYQLLLAHLYACGADGQVSLGAGSDFSELLDALAHLGESERHLDELRTLLVRTVTDSGGALLALLGPSTRHALSAALTDPARSHDYFARSARALQGPREQVQRAIVTTDQALARIRLGESESAAELLHGCIHTASATGGRVAAIRLRRARSDLRPWRREPWFADLDDHLIESLGA